MYAFGDYVCVPRHAEAQEKILTEIIVCNSVCDCIRGFFDSLSTFLGTVSVCPASSCPGDNFDLNHSLLLGLTVPAGIRPNEYVLGDCFGVPRHGDAQEKILSQIIVCSTNLSVRGSFFDLLNTLLRTISVCLDMLMPRRGFCPKS